MNADVYKIDANGKVSPQTGLSTLKLLVPHVDPVVLDVNYKLDQDGSYNYYSELKRITRVFESLYIGRGIFNRITIPSSVLLHVVLAMIINIT